MTCQGISLGLVSIGCCCFLFVTRSVLIFVIHTECLGGHGVFFVPNFRIVSSHGMSRNNLFYHELSNYRISFTRSVTDVLCPEFADFFLTRTVAEITDFFVTRLVLGPTERREVIIELSNIFHTECRGGHGFFLITRLVLGPTDQRGG